MIDWLKSWWSDTFHTTPTKYDTDPFWKWLTKYCQRLVLTNRDGDVVLLIHDVEHFLLNEMRTFVYALSHSTEVHVRRETIFGSSDEIKDPLEILLLLGTKAS